MRFALIVLQLTIYNHLPSCTNVFGLAMFANKLATADSARIA